MRILVMIGSLLAICTSTAFAIGDQGPDMLGFYFDNGATEYYAVSDPFSEIQIHLVLTNPTMAEISGWEAGFDIHGTAWFGEPNISHGGINSLDGQFFSVNFSTPLPCAGPTVLATISITPVDDVCNCIRLFGTEEPAIPGELPVLYLSDGGLQQVETCVFDGSDASAQLNGDAPVIGSPWPCEDTFAFLVAAPVVAFDAEALERRAEEALVGFFAALADADFESAAGLYGGSYEGLRDWNPSLDLENKVALWEFGCTRNGLRCLEVRRVLEHTLLPNGKYRLIVEFSTPDGELFVRGPCCGDDPTTSPPDSTFSYEVGDVGGRFKVFGLPPYVP